MAHLFFKNSTRYLPSTSGLSFPEDNVVHSEIWAMSKLEKNALSICPVCLLISDQFAQLC